MVAISIHAPLAGRDYTVLTSPALGVIISIHAPLAGRDVLQILSVLANDISIHAPLAGRDVRTCPLFGGKNISIHAPLAGRDNSRFELDCKLHQFQSTRPLRGATFAADYYGNLAFISIHAPLAGRDCCS